MNFFKYILLGLLSALPLALRGQADLPLHRGDDWQTLSARGGIWRNGEYFVRSYEGLGEFVMMDYVNGFALGPSVTVGKVLKDYSRLELDTDIKWAFSREKLMAKAAARYIFAPQYNGFLEVFGGKFTNDFDRYPVLDNSLRSTAVSLFGWSHFKLYEQTTFGTRLYGALGPYWQITGLLAWEKRKQLETHRKTNVFGKDAVENVPYVQKQRMENFGVNKILRLDFQLDYVPGRKIMVVDDMTAYAQSSEPTFSLRQTSGFNHGLEFLSLELSVLGQHQGWKRNEQIAYYASTGFFPVKKRVMLMDMRHFDASSFSLTRGFGLTQFSLLDNYELSTGKSWIEGHAEWNNGLFYGQVHAVKVPDCQAHEELSAGVSFMNFFRIGLSVGFDDAKYDGVAFNLGLKM